MAGRWGPAEDRLLLELYAGGTPRRLIAERLGRSADAIDARRRALAAAPRSEPPRGWSPREDAFLRAATRARVPAVEIARRLGRRPHAVRVRKHQLALTARPAPRYGEREDERLAAALLSGRPLREVAAELGRSEDALRLRLTKLGLYAPSASRRRWSSAEDARLRAGYRSGLGASRLSSESLCGRTATAVGARARRLGLATYARRWTEAEERELVALARALFPLDAVASTLHRSREAITGRCRRLGLPLPSPASARAGMRWSAADDALLVAHAGRDTFTLARLSGRPEAAVRSRQRRLGLARPERSQHHPLRGRADEVLPGQRRLLAREAPLTVSQALALSQRLALPLGAVRQLAQLRGGRVPARGTPTRPSGGGRDLAARAP